jgi:hypothetical protein
LNDIPCSFVRQKRGISASDSQPAIFKTLRSSPLSTPEVWSCDKLSVKHESSISANKNAARRDIPVATALWAVTGDGSQSRGYSRCRVMYKQKRPAWTLPAGRFETNYETLFRIKGAY